MKAISTIYNGVRFRSRLEARWAAFFDNCSFNWSYEPIDFHGWAPDFKISTKAGPAWVEVKPIDFDCHNPEDIARKAPELEKVRATASRWRSLIGDLDAVDAMKQLNDANGKLIVDAWSGKTILDTYEFDPECPLGSNSWLASLDWDDVIARSKPKPDLYGERRHAQDEIIVCGLAPFNYYGDGCLGMIIDDPTYGGADPAVLEDGYDGVPVDWRGHYGSFHHRISGKYDGDHHIQQIPWEDTQKAWHVAGSMVQWRAD
jgi:hypothetical protein